MRITSRAWFSNQELMAQFLNPTATAWEKASALSFYEADMTSAGWVEFGYVGLDYDLPPAFHDSLINRAHVALDAQIDAINLRAAEAVARVEQTRSNLLFLAAPQPTAGPAS